MAVITCLGDKAIRRSTDDDRDIGRATLRGVGSRQFFSFLLLRIWSLFNGQLGEGRNISIPFRRKHDGG